MASKMAAKLENLDFKGIFLPFYSHVADFGFCDAGKSSYSFPGLVASGYLNK